MRVVCRVFWMRGFVRGMVVFRRSYLFFGGWVRFGRLGGACFFSGRSLAGAFFIFGFFRLFGEFA